MQTAPRAKLESRVVWLVRVCESVCLSLSLIIPRLRQIEGDLPFDLNLHTIYP